MRLGKFVGRIATVVALFAAYSIVQTLAMIPTVASAGKAPTWLVAGVFAVAFGSLIYFLASVYQFFLRSERPKVYGPRHLDWRVARFMLGMVVLLAVIQVALSLATNLHVTPEATNQKAVTGLLQQAPLAMTLIAVIGAPPVEELLFRGLLMHSFPYQEQPRWLWVSGAVSSVVFGLMHAGFNEPVNLLGYSALGAVFALTYAYTKDVRYSIVLHFLNNFVALFL